MSAPAAGAPPVVAVVHSAVDGTSERAAVAALLSSSINELNATIDSSPFASALRRSVMERRAAVPGSRGAERWTFIDAFSLALHMRSPAAATAWTARWSPASMERYSRHVLRAVRACPDPTKWDQEFICNLALEQIQRAHIEASAPRSPGGGTPAGRPLGSIKQLFAAVIAFIKILPPAAAPDWSKSRDLRQATKSLLENLARDDQADRPQLRAPTFSIDIAIRCAAGAEHLTLSDLLHMPMNKLRVLATTVFAAQNPSRGVEIASGLRYQRAEIADSLTAARRPVLSWLRAASELEFQQRFAAPFVIVFTITRTKGDRARQGVERSMPHNPSLAFSPGGIALVYMWRRLGLASISARVDETRQDWFVFAPVGSDITRWATTRDISRDLAQTVLESSGVARAGSRAWRSAAVAWLRSGGFDLDDICKRGAWYKLDTVLEHYLRQKDPEPQVLERLFGRR